MRQTFIFDKLVASNFSAPAGSPLDAGDTDSDGLTDAQELAEGTLPWVADTDGDGFSDGVEVWARDTRGGMFTPNQVPLPDGGEPRHRLPAGAARRRLGLRRADRLRRADHRHQRASAVDSDDDGISDSVEFKLGSQPSSKDLPQDPDNDRLAHR